MGITLNRVGIEIDGQVYHFYKLTFGFQRKLIEVQSRMNTLRNEVAKKYKVDISEIEASDKVPDEKKIELAQEALKIQDSIASLFVNKEEAAILDNFDSNSIAQLIEALK